VNEPDNHTALVDRDGGTWVRVDECPGQYGKWWPITDGPGWEPQVQDGVGQSARRGRWSWFDGRGTVSVDVLDPDLADHPQVQLLEPGPYVVRGPEGPVRLHRTCDGWATAAAVATAAAQVAVAVMSLSELIRQILGESR